MGFLQLSGRVLGGSLFLLFAVASTGCAMQPVVTKEKLIQHQQVMNTTGLKDVTTFDVVKARAAVPQKWDQLNIKKTALFTDLQWRSPSKQTGVGVAYIRMPLPLPPATLMWFAKNEYCKKSDDGKLIDEWVDNVGRSWFEAENKKYHVRGFVITKGFEAWIVYSGYRMDTAPNPEEMTVAKRAQETILPTPIAPTNAQTPTATAD